MRVPVSKTFWLAALVLIFTSKALAQREQVFVGARPLGLGETFVAIANDGNAIYWNPAGLSYLQREEFNSMYANLYGLGIKNSYISYARPLFSRLAFGLDWMRYGFDDGELTFARNQIALSSGLAINESFAVGANVKYLNTEAKLEGSSEGNAGGWGFDAGALYRRAFEKRKFLRELRAGLMLHDVAGTRVRYDTGKREKILPQNLRLGLAYKPFETARWKGLRLHEPLFAVDLDDRLHLGGEIWLFDGRPLALRGGLQKDRHTNEGLSLAFGFSIQQHALRLDYAYTMPPTLPASHRFSLSFSYNFNPHLVEINEIQIEPVFSSLARHYENPAIAVGKALLKNRSNKPIVARVSFEAKDYTKGRWTRTVQIDTGKVVPVELQADFAESFRQEADTEKSVRGEVKVSYEYQGKTYTEKTAVRFFLLGDGSIRWDQPGRAAAFVTKDDSLVRAFAIAARQLRQSPTAIWFQQREIADAMKIYEALRRYKVKPSPDPNATFSAATQSGFYIDTIVWPDALLSKPDSLRVGDCEDLAILYASLLESIGIETALLKRTGHIFMMFNTGIPVAHRYSLPLPDSLSVKARGTLWLPVETTQIESPFLAAWREGAMKEYWPAAKNEDLQTLFVHDEQRQYPPLLHAPIKRTRLLLPDSSLIGAAREYDYDLQEIETWKNQFLETRFWGLLRRDPDNLPARNQLGCIYAGLAKFDLARAQFDTVLKFDSTYAPTLNNLGNVYFVEGNLEQARRYYESSLKSPEFKLGTYLNAAILYQMLAQEKGETAEAQRWLDQSIEALENAARLFESDSLKALSLLGIANEEIGVMAEDKPVTWKQRAKEVKRLINTAFRRFVKKQHVAVEKPILRSAGPTGSQEDEDRRFILYWDFE